MLIINFSKHHCQKFPQEKKNKTWYWLLLHQSPAQGVYSEQRGNLSLSCNLIYICTQVTLPMCCKHATSKICLNYNEVTAARYFCFIHVFYNWVVKFIIHAMKILVLSVKFIITEILFLILLIFYWLSLNNEFYAICYIKKTIWVIKILKRC